MQSNLIAELKKTLKEYGKRENAWFFQTFWQKWAEDK